MTDARLQSTKPIDDEIPFEDAKGLRDAAPDRPDALVHPAAAERAFTERDGDVEMSLLDDAPVAPGETDATADRP